MILLCFSCSDDNSKKTKDESGPSKDSWEIQSPSKSLTFQIELSKLDGSLSYKILRDKRTIIEKSKLGLKTKNSDFLSGLSFVELNEKPIKQSYKMLLGKRK